MKVSLLQPALLKHGVFMFQRPCHALLAITLGFYWDNGKRNGNYYLGFRAVSGI